MSTLRWAGVPSSSMAKQPHSSAIVPSSTSVTSGDATCWPSRPLNTDAPLSTRSFSRPWPQASWNSTPPPPGPMTTGRVPDGRRAGGQLGDGPAGGGAGDVLDLVAVEQLEADRAAERLVAGLHAGVAGGHGRHHEQRADLVVGGQQAVAVGHQDLAAGVAVAGPHLADRAALGPGGLVGPAQQLDLGALGHGLGQDGDLVGPGRRRWRVSATSRTPPPPERAAAAAASAAVRRPSSDRSAVWAKPVVSPTTTRMPAPRSRPEDSSSTRPSSSMADDDRLSSTNTSAKSPPVRRAAARVRWMAASSSTGDLVSDGRAGVWRRAAAVTTRSRRGGQAGAVSPAGGVAAYCTRVPLQPGLAAPSTSTCATTTRPSPCARARCRCWPRPDSSPCARRRRSRRSPATVPDGHTTVGMRVQLDHLAPTAVGCEVTRRGAASRRSRAGASRSPSRPPTTGASIAAGKVTRVVVDVEKFMEKSG